MIEILFQVLLEDLHFVLKVAVILLWQNYAIIKLLQGFYRVINLLLLLLYFGLQIGSKGPQIIDVISLEIVNWVKYILKAFLILLHQICDILFHLFPLICELPELSLHFWHLKFQLILFLPVVVMDYLLDFLGIWFVNFNWDLKNLWEGVVVCVWVFW